MKKTLVLAMAAAMFLSPVLSTAAAVEPIRQTQVKEAFEGPRGGRRGPRRGGWDRGRRHRGGSSGGWVAAGILGAALVGTAIASNNSRSTPTYVYEQPTTVVVPSTPTYVYQSPTVVYPQSNVVVDPTVYTYDANGNLVPYYQGY